MASEVTPLYAVGYVPHSSKAIHVEVKSGGYAAIGLDGALNSAHDDTLKRRKALKIAVAGLGGCAVFLGVLSAKTQTSLEGAVNSASSSSADGGALQPFSTASPGSLGMPAVLRAFETRPLDVWDFAPEQPEGPRSSSMLTNALLTGEVVDDNERFPTTADGATGNRETVSKSAVEAAAYASVEELPEWLRALPTNEWWENLAMGAGGNVENGPENFANCLPYHVDVSLGPEVKGRGDLERGLRVVAPVVVTQAVANRYCQVVDCSASWVTNEPTMLPDDHAVVSVADPATGVVLSAATGGVSSTPPLRPHKIPSYGKLGVALSWAATAPAGTPGAGTGVDGLEGTLAMRAPLVVGMAYTTMEYFGGIRPKVSAAQSLASPLTADGSAAPLPCPGRFEVNEWLEMFFAESDQTWLLFTSRPLTFTCSTVNASIALEAEPYLPGADSEEGAAAALAQGGLSAVLRLALLNNCTGGTGPACSAFDSDATASSSDSTTSSSDATAAVAAPDDSNHNNNSNNSSTTSSGTSGAANGGATSVAASEQVAAWRAVLVANADLYPSESSSVFYEVHEGSGKGSSGSSSSGGNNDDAFDDTSSASDDSALGSSSATATLVFDWSPRSMKGAATSSDADSSKEQHNHASHSSSSSSSSSTKSTRGAANTATEGAAALPGAPSLLEAEPMETSTATVASSPNVLMYALQHHWSRLTGPMEVSALGRVATVRGLVAPITGASSSWTQSLPLPRLAFQASNPIANGRQAALNEALNADLNYQVPLEFELAAGSTYVGGKMLAKLARLALVAEELGRHADAMVLAQRLADSLEVWISADKALAPLLYDAAWGGAVSCGCYFDPSGEGKCGNKVSGTDCPGLYDLGQNFGQGFFQDHHFHFGYHLYAAAVVAKFLPAVAVAQKDRVLLMVRDIANPSPSDPYFPLWRHKDWYLGSSWASGIVKRSWGPDPHGRNQESISEAVNAYDALQLYGEHLRLALLATGGAGSSKGSAASTGSALAVAAAVRDTGRVMLATELEAAKAFWQVCGGAGCGSPGAPDFEPRTYPASYAPRVVGQIWSTTAEMQTWFGSAPWKVYGIQLLPQTAISEALWASSWIRDGVLAAYATSCESDPTACVGQGWSTLSWGAAAVLGGCRVAWDHVASLPSSVYETDGGNGQSRTNALWWIATRCPYDE